MARALTYLKSTQQADGGWDAGFGRATSVTSLAVLAFLAAGHVPDAPGPYRQTVERGIRYVVDHQRPNGLLVSNTSHGPMYCHGVSTLMLAEVAGMIGDDPELESRCRSALARAVKLTLLAQNLVKNPGHSGGWRYQPTSRDSDLSVTGWQVMALRAAKGAGCSVPAENIDRALDYIRLCAAKEENDEPANRPAPPPGSLGFCYQPGGGAPNNPRTGTAILALEICGTHNSPEAQAGARYLLAHPARWENPYFFYEAYYCPQALFQVGPDAFAAYASKLFAILLEHQDPDGSWLSADGNERAVGRVYCTAMGVLALAVEYRYLPIYQR